MDIPDTIRFLETLQAVGVGAGQPLENLRAFTTAILLAEATLTNLLLGDFFVGPEVVHPAEGGTLS